MKNSCRLYMLLSLLLFILTYNHIHAFTLSKSLIRTTLSRSLPISTTNLFLIITNKDKASGTTYSKITTIETPREFLDFLNEDDRLCIVKYYASWCKSCKRFDIRLRKFVSVVGDQQDAQGNIIRIGKARVAKVEIATNANMCRKLGITKLPYIQIYRGDNGLLSEFVCAPKDFHVLVEKANSYWEDVNLEVTSDGSEEGNEEDVYSVTDL